MISLPRRLYSRARSHFVRRQILIHAHLFKNAGSTLDWSLRRNFRQGHLEHTDDDAMHRGAAYLGPYLQANGQLKALSSHWISLPLPRLARADIHLLILLRDPIERIGSVYNFERRQTPAETPGAIKAKECDFLDYVRWRLQPMTGPTIKNFQTCYCSGNYLGADLSALYQQAEKNLAGTPLVGLVDRYDESMVLFEYLLGKPFPHIDLAYRIQNASAGPGLSLQDRRDAVLTGLSAIAEEVVAANAYDIALYEKAAIRFEEALLKIPDFPDRLENLRRRNEALA